MLRRRRNAERTLGAQTSWAGEECAVAGGVSSGSRCKELCPQREEKRKAWRGKKKSLRNGRVWTSNPLKKVRARKIEKNPDSLVEKERKAS